MGSARRTVKTWIRYLLLGVAVAYVVFGLAGTAGVLFAASSAQHDLEALLPAAEREADRSRDVVRRSMQSHPIEMPPPVRDPRPVSAASYSWRELSCEIRSIDSGWIAVDFEQACELVDVDLYPTSLQPAEGSSTTGVEWSVDPDVPVAVSEPDPATGSLGRCGFVPADHIVPNFEQWPNDPGLTFGSHRHASVSTWRPVSNCRRTRDALGGPVRRRSWLHRGRRTPCCSPVDAPNCCPPTPPGSS